MHLLDEVRYMQRLAAERGSRIVTIGPVLLFTTESGDAWILDPSDHLAARIADTGEPRSIHIVETDKRFEVGWQGRYEVIGPAFVFTGDKSGRTTTILGYPTLEITGRIADVFG